MRKARPQERLVDGTHGDWRTACQTEDERDVQLAEKSALTWHDFARNVWRPITVPDTGVINTV